MTKYLGVEYRQRVGITLKRLRESAGLGQRALAKDLGINHTHVGRLERGAAGASDELLTLYERRFGLKPGGLIGFKNEGAMSDDPRGRLYVGPNHGGTEQLIHFSLQIRLAPSGKCKKWLAKWQTSFEHVGGYATSLVLVGGPETGLGHLKSDKRTGEVDSEEVYSSYPENRSHSNMRFDQSLEPGEVAQMEVEGRPRKSLRQIVIVPSRGQVFRDVTVEVVFPETWKYQRQISIWRINQKIDDGAVAVSPRHQELRGMLTVNGTRNLFSGKEDANVGPTFRFSDQTAGDAFGVQWEVMNLFTKVKTAPSAVDSKKGVENPLGK